MGMRTDQVQPDAVFYDSQMGELNLRDEDVRRSPDPAQAILDFFENTYEIAARRRDWNRSRLEFDPTARYVIRRRRSMSRQKQCTHQDQIQNVTPSAQGCEDCLKTGDSWVHLRICLICGHVGCCDSSKNKHATKHYHDTSHPIVQSFQPGEDWRWCYIDATFV
jgi:hypothetical protein